MDGLLFSDHTPTPGLIEWKKAIEPVQILDGSTHQSIRIINRYDFATLDHLKCEWSVVGDGFTRPRKPLSITEGIKPGTTAELKISDVDLTDLPAESYVEVSFSLKEDTNWAKAGHEVAWGQVAIKSGPTLAALKLAHASTEVSVTKVSPTTLEITGSPSNKWTFDLIKGQVISWVKNGQELIKSTFDLSFYRALTDNDIPEDGKYWRSKRLHQTVTHTSSVTAAIDPITKSYIITVQARTAPPVFEWGIDTTTTYTFTSTSLSIHLSGKPSGINLPKTFARLGLTFSIPKSANFTQASWFGRGPGENYKDKKLSQRFGNWSKQIPDLWVPYEFPQESGNRTDVRWVEFQSGSTSSILESVAQKVIGKEHNVGLKASFGDQEGCSFQASHYDVSDVDEAKHPYELEEKRKEEVIVRLDWDHHGLGTGSCGPKTLDKYALSSGDFEYEVLLE